MKLKRTILTALALNFSSFALAGSGRPLVYVNENLGFNVEGYNYAQAEYPCNLDKVLVEQIIKRGAASNIDMEAVSTPDKIRSGEVPVLAIDIDALVLGSDEFTFGTRSRSNLPSVRVTAALIKNDTPEGFVTAKHSCAIATLNEVTSSSSVLDMGTYGHTVCSVTHRCLNELSRDIVQWIEPQVR